LILTVTVHAADIQDRDGARLAGKVGGENRCQFSFLGKIGVSSLSRQQNRTDTDFPSKIELTPISSPFRFPPRCQARSARARGNHIGMAIRAFARLSWHFYSTGVSWYESKAEIVREAIRTYRTKPLYKMPSTA